MGPVCKFCKNPFLPGGTFFTTSCGFVFHKNCGEREIKASGTCPCCDKYLHRSPFRRINLTFSKSKYESTDILKKAYEDQINQLKKKEHEKNHEILNLEKIIKTLNTSLESKCKALSAYGHQLKDKETKLDSKINDLTTCQTLLKDQRNLTINLYDLVKDDLKKCAVMSAEEENLRRELESSQARCAEQEKTINDLNKVIMKETTLRQQFKEKVAAFEKENNDMQKRLLELERMTAELLPTRDYLVPSFEFSAAKKRELNHEPATGINESDRKRAKVNKNTKENVPASQRILRSSNPETVKKV